MLTTLTRKVVTAARPTAQRALSSTAHNFTLPVEFKTHECDGPGLEVQATSEELLSYYTDMQMIRRMEITADNEYKVRTIRGFCHLYDGQEAVAVGTQAALDDDDDWITSYRCHGIAYVRGLKVEEILGELMGRSIGCSGGKGGSMHLYNTKKNFWGGSGIVGGQVPCGTGTAFANWYRQGNAQGDEPMNCAVAFYGDGAANQGQIWESANMAQLWKLPMIFVTENNKYGMGTSVARHSSTPYYQMGKVIPGIWCDGMDVLSVKHAFEYAKAHVGSGKGPMFVEVETYRYHGHSMSDPGLTYRDRAEVQDVRATRDCIKGLEQRILDCNVATEAELKDIEKEARKVVKAANTIAKNSDFPDPKELYTDIYWQETPKFIRGAEITTSQYN